MCLISLDLSNPLPHGRPLESGLGLDSVSHQRDKRAAGQTAPDMNMKGSIYIDKPKQKSINIELPSWSQQSNGKFAPNSKVTHSGLEVQHHGLLEGLRQGGVLGFWQTSGQDAGDGGGHADKEHGQRTPELGQLRDEGGAHAEHPTKSRQHHIYLNLNFPPNAILL